MQGHAQPVADPLCIGEVLGRRAVPVAIVLLPVLHEHRLHRDTRLDQSHQCNRGIDAAGDRHHRRGVVVGTRKERAGEGSGGRHRDLGRGLRQRGF